MSGVMSIGNFEHTHSTHAHSQGGDLIDGKTGEECLTLSSQCSGVWGLLISSSCDNVLPAKSHCSQTNISVYQNDPV